MIDPQRCLTEHAALTRRAVFARDGWVCQYCGLAAENKWKVCEVRPQRQTLEDLFVRLTGHEEEAAAAK